MNEIIGPIYYVFASDSNTEWRGRSFRRRSLVFWFFGEVLKDDKSYPILSSHLVDISLRSIYEETVTFRGKVQSPSLILIYLYFYIKETLFAKFYG